MSDEKSKNTSVVMTFKAKPAFKAHLEAEAQRRGIHTGTYIKEVLKKFSKYKEKPLI